MINAIAVLATLGKTAPPARDDDSALLARQSAGTTQVSWTTSSAASWSVRSAERWTG